MALHQLSRITMGVPDAARTGSYYAEFGLRQIAAGRFATLDGGEQLRIETAPRRRLLALEVSVDDGDDVGRIRSSLHRIGAGVQTSVQSLRTYDPGTEVTVHVAVRPRLRQEPVLHPDVNAPGHVERANSRAAGVLRNNPVQPRRLGHVVLGSIDQPSSERFFVEGLGFKVSDRVPGAAAFLRCSSDHHNVLVQQAPVAFLHHTSWQVDDVDEVGRGATAMLQTDPSRHVWGLGRHHIGSNFFWYLRDPAGNFSEYYADLDCIVDDQLWTPGDWEGMHALWNWGPPPPPSFLEPEDLAALMTGAHSQ